MKHNWIFDIDKNKIKEFVEQNLHANVDIVSPVLDENYGKVYLFHLREEMSDITGKDGHSLALGNFAGVLKVKKTGEVVDDFELLKKAPGFAKKYIMFVARENLVDDEPRKINGKTYGETVIAELTKYINQISAKGIAAWFSKETPKDKKYLEVLLQDLKDELFIIENYLRSEQKQ